MRKYTAVFAALMVVALAAPSFAGIDEGDWSARLSGFAQFEDYANDYGVMTQLGYFVTPEVEVGVEVGIEVWDPDNGSSETYWNFHGFAAYNFQMDGEWVPYVGGFLGWLDWDDGYDTMVFGAFVGVKFFVHEKADIFFEWRFEYRTDKDFKDADQEFGHGLMVGFEILF